MLLWATFDQDSVIVRVKILDSAVATGVGKTGLAFNTAGLVIGTIADSEAAGVMYRVADTTIEDITTLGTYAAPTATKCRFKEVSATDFPGIYELQFANARFAIAGAKSLLIAVHGASGAAQCDAVIPLPVFDLFTASVPQTGDSFARLGATAGASVSADVAAVKAETAAILTDTAEIGAAGAGLTALATQASVNTIDGIVDDILVDTGTTVPAQIAALNNLSAAQVNAEVVDALNVDTYAEPGQEAPPATTTIQKKLGYVYKMLINKKTQTVDTRSLFNAAGTTVDQKATDGEAAGTYTKGALGTGP